MKTAATGICLVIIVSGCQLTPMTGGVVRTSHTLRQEPHRAAVCVARNLDALFSAFEARIRQGKDPVLIEVHVTRGEPVALAQFMIRGEGSTAEVTTLPALGVQRDEFVAALLTGC